VFSLDGSKIAFMSVRDGYWQIYIMNIDGSGQMNLSNLSNTLAYDAYPTWGRNAVSLSNAVENTARLKVRNRGGRRTRIRH
jgi:TolB protein